MKNEKWDDVHGNTTPDDRMVAFLESPTDSYVILQLREDVDDNIPLMFANYSYLQKKEMEPEIDRYEVVYHGSISVSGDVNRQLEDLYVRFNIDHPNDFRGHSMSVSDIVALKVAGEVSFHYVDSVGFQKLENFMKSENYLKNAEMAICVICSFPCPTSRQSITTPRRPRHRGFACGHLIIICVCCSPRCCRIKRSATAANFFCCHFRQRWCKANHFPTFPTV